MKFDKFYHGGDYNPEQWLDRPDILEKDIEMFKSANINFVSIGIFSWSKLEPSEGNYNFAWLDDVVKKLTENGISIIMATPSGAKPAWLASAYPEVQRVGETLVRELHGNRHTHCITSPVYREKVYNINKLLAQRYAFNDNILMWHISNEYSGHCYCPLCQQKFRNYLEEKYVTIENLNELWWNTFWSHDFSSFDEINAPSQNGEMRSIPLNAEWERFTTLNTIDFYNNEVAAIKSVNANILATTNLHSCPWMHLDYFEFAKHIDVSTYDAYPEWHSSDDTKTALDIAFLFDLTRGVKNGETWFLMESTPSTSNWRYASKLKRPKMHELSSILAVATGSDSVGYFQMRKCRGQTEKFHSAVIDHDNRAGRVYNEVAKTGKSLKLIEEVVGSKIYNEVAIYYDWNNKIVLDNNAGPKKGINNAYVSEVMDIHAAITKLGFGVDIISKDTDFSKYKAIVVPMGYALNDKTWDELEIFAKSETLITTEMSGYANEIDLIHPNCKNSQLEALSGVKWLEIDGLYDNDANSTTLDGEKILFKDMCEINEISGAEILASYEQDFYAGEAVITCKNNSYHIAARSDINGYKTIFKNIFGKKGIKPLKEAHDELLVTKRESENYEYIFMLNFNDHAVKHSFGAGYTDLFTNLAISEIELAKYEYAIIKKQK